MPDAVATPEESSEAVDSQTQEVDTKEQPQEIDLQEADSHEQEVEVACPRCDRPTSVRVSNPGAEIHVRPSIAGFGEHTAARCADGHEFWIYYC